MTLFRYHFGNNLGTVFFVWKRDSVDETDDTAQGEISAINYIKKNLPHFATRKMRREFIDRYSK